MFYYILFIGWEELTGYDTQVCVFSRQTEGNQFIQREYFALTSDWLVANYFGHISLISPLFFYCHYYAVLTPQTHLRWGGCGLRLAR